MFKKNIYQISHISRSFYYKNSISSGQKGKARMKNLQGQTKNESKKVLWLCFLFEGWAERELSHTTKTKLEISLQKF